MESKPLPAWKKGLGISLTLSITTALFVLFYNFDEETLESLLHLRREYLLAAALMVFLLWVIEGLRLQMLVFTLSHSKRISLLAGMQIFLMTFFFTAVTPFAAGEWPANIYALKRFGLSLGEATAVTVMRAFITRLLFTATALLILVHFRGRPIPAFLNQVYIYATGISLLTVLVLLLLIWKPHLLEWLLQKLLFIRGSVRGRRLYSLVKQELVNYQEATGSLNRWKGGAVILISLLTAGYWFCFFSIAPVLLLGLNRIVPFPRALLWQFFIQMITVYIPLPGGSGVVELGLARLYSLFVPVSVLGLFILSWRFFTYYLLLFFGGLITLNKIKL